MTRAFPFTGHTEFFANYTHTDHVVMLLCSGTLRVALATTHIPLAKVSQAITQTHLHNTLTILHGALHHQWHCEHPRILVCGLNPHAGEGGYLGREEIDVIAPVIRSMQKTGFDIQGPYPADTIFAPHSLKKADAILAMYHDQGLPVIKYAHFGQAVNVTLGLPFIRTSVDHGTALNVAGSGQSNPDSLHAALQLAKELPTTCALA